MARHRRRATYRLSLLALVGDGQSEALAGPVAELARVPLRLPCPMRAARSAVTK